MPKGRKHPPAQRGRKVPVKLREPFPGKIRLGYLLLGFYAITAFSLRNDGIFVDEGAALDLGSQILKGFVLYRDLFHHHMPLPVYLAAAITSITGPSLPMERFAIFLLDLIVFVLVFSAGAAPLATGFAAAVWALISPYYLGNMLLYDHLTMLGGLVLGVLAFSALARGLPPSPLLFAMLASASAVVCLSNPFFVFTAFFATGSLFFAHQIPRSFVLKLWLTIGGVLVCYGAYLAATGSLSAFYEDVVIFNTTTYQRFSPWNMAYASKNQLQLLHLFNPVWFRSLDPFRFNTDALSSSAFDEWIFSGLYFRIVALCVCLIFVWRRNYKTALFLLTFEATVSLRGEQGFHASPFVVFSLFLGGVCIEECTLLKGKARVALIALSCLSPLLMSVSGSRYLVRHAFRSDSATEGLLYRASLIQEAAQNRQDVKLGQFPAGNYMYYLTGLAPFTRFVYYYPWVAVTGKAGMDWDLSHQPPEAKLLLILDIDGNVWGMPNSETLRDEIAWAKANLVTETFSGMTVFASPSVAFRGN